MQWSRFNVLPTSVLLAAGLSACTTHLTAKPEAASDTGPSYGIPYRLPMKQFAIKVSWELEECLNGVQMREAGLPSGEAGLRYKVKPDYTAEFVEGESIVMDYRQMTNRFKTGELTVDYWAEDEKRQTRFVKSINGTIEGREAEALKSGIETVTNLAKTVLTLSGGAPLGTAEAPAAPQPVSCNQETLDNLATLKLLDAELKTITESAAKIQSRADILKARTALGKLTKPDENEYAAIVKEIDRLTARREEIEKLIGSIRTRLTYTETFRYPSKPLTSANRENFVADPKKAEAWLKSLLRSDLAQRADEEAQLLMITAGFEPVGGDSATPTIQTPTCGTGPAPVCLGYVYREPAAARLRIATRAGSQENVLSEKVESVPQIGRIRILPLRSRWGEKNGLAADFFRDGTPIKISYKAIEAGGPRMAAAASTASASALEIATLIAKDREADEKEAKGARAEELAALKLEIEMLENEKKLAALQTGAGSELTDLKAQIELVENQTKLAKLLGAPPEQVTSLNAELAILRLQKEKAELEAAIREANQK